MTEFERRDAAVRGELMNLRDTTAVAIVARIAAAYRGDEPAEGMAEEIDGRMAALNDPGTRAWLRELGALMLRMPRAVLECVPALMHPEPEIVSFSADDPPPGFRSLGPIIGGPADDRGWVVAATAAPEGDQRMDA